MQSMTLSKLHMHLDNMIADHPEWSNLPVFVQTYCTATDEAIRAVKHETSVRIGGDHSTACECVMVLMDGPIG